MGYATRGLVWAVGLSLSVGCPAEEEGVDADTETAGDEDSANGGSACVPGQSVGCVCADGSMGAQVCQSDGAGLGACSCDGSDSAGGDGGPTAGDGGGDSGNGGGDGGATTIVSFSRDVVPIFEKSCGASAMGCHDAEPYNATIEAGCRGWLSLTQTPVGSVHNSGPAIGQATGCADFTLHQRLLDIGAWSCSPLPDNPGAGGGVIKKFIVPFDPDSSYLLQRANLQATPCDLPMDPDPMPPVGDISDEDLDTIELWILQGALDN